MKFIVIGLLSTLFMDIHVYLHSKVFCSIPTRCDLTGRWIGVMLKREKIHGKITEMAAWKHEKWLGWLGHYVMGTTIVSLFLSIVGKTWLNNQTLFPLILFLCVMMLFPFCVLQPIFGFGYFGLKTQNPKATIKRVLVAYFGFALGIYVSAQFVGRF